MDGGAWCDRESGALAATSEATEHFVVEASWMVRGLTSRDEVMRGERQHSAIRLCSSGRLWLLWDAVATATAVVVGRRYAGVGAARVGPTAGFLHPHHPAMWSVWQRQVHGSALGQQLVQLL